jgi:hypothetical protein
MQCRCFAVPFFVCAPPYHQRRKKKFSTTVINPWKRGFSRRFMNEKIREFFFCEFNKHCFAYVRSTPIHHRFFCLYIYHQFYAARFGHYFTHSGRLLFSSHFRLNLHWANRNKIIKKHSFLFFTHSLTLLLLITHETWLLDTHKKMIVLKFFFFQCQMLPTVLFFISEK